MLEKNSWRSPESWNNKPGLDFEKLRSLHGKRKEGRISERKDSFVEYSLYRMGGEQAGPRTLVLTVALSLLCALERTCAQKFGFISIDCGGTKNYTDPVTGIQWVTDDGYIATGINVNISTNIQKADNLEALKTSRCFPSTASGARKKNCYSLPVIRSSTYLVRAFFLHGTGPAESDTITFRISIESMMWGTVLITPTVRNQPLWAEAIFIAESDHTDMCTLDLGKGTPCIASLELRPLGNTYKPELIPNHMLGLVRRYSCGSPITPESIRFPLDEYDRIWEGTYVDPATVTFTPVNVRSINTTLPFPTNVLTALNDDRPPIAVMQSADEDTQFKLLGDTAKYLALTSTFIVKLYVWDFVPYTASDTNVVRQFDSIMARRGREDVFMTSTVGASNTVSVNSSRVTITSNSDYSVFLLRTTNFSQRPAMLNSAEIFADIPLQQPTYPNDLSALVGVQNDFGLSPLWAGDPCLPSPWDWIKCNNVSSLMRVTSLVLSDVKLRAGISSSIWNLTELTDLWLTGTNLNGTIPDEISSLKNLRTLHLNNNSLTGLVPASLAGLPDLVELYINDNDLSGKLPSELLNKKILQIKASGNPKLQCNGPCDTGTKRSNIGLIIGAVCGSVVVVLIALFAFLPSYLKSRPPTYSQPDLLEKNELSSVALVPDPAHRAAVENGARTFTLAEIQAATQDFHTMIAEGGFGSVYYGKLADGQEVAVKVHSASGHQGAKEFFMEVDLLSRIHHRNLVTLVGHCQEAQEQILVYAYMKKGTLRDHLYGGARRTHLDWRTRLDIALDSARGLTYLHTGCQPSIIHRDVKSNNILLDDKMRAKVADFGISRVTGDDETAVETMVKGTLGYLDPEYFQTQRLTQKSDVYSFGVVLLEIVTGRRPVSNGCPLKEMVQGHMNDSDLKAIADPALEGDYDPEAMWKVVELGIECLNLDPIYRPDMLGVVGGLTEAMELERSARAHPQRPTTRSGASSSSSAGQKGVRASSFRPDSSGTSMSSSADFVNGLIPR